jgi:AraC family transcriptional regulator
MTSSSNPTLTVNPTQIGTLHQVLPDSPTLTDKPLTDQPRVVVYHYEQCPTHEVPAYEPLYHLVPVMGLQSEANVESKLENNQFYKGRYGQGTVGLTPSGVTHQILWDRPIDLTLVFLKPQFVDQVAAEMTRSDRVTLIPKHITGDLTLAHLGLLLKNELAAEHPTGLLYRESIATALAARLIQHHSASDVTLPSAAHKLSAKQLQTIFDYIQSNLDQEIRLVDLAQLINFSEYHLCRIFKQSTGLSLYQCVLRQRVALAQRLLQQTDLKIADIALRCGFSSHSHLTRYFKQITGVSPRSLRASEQDHASFQGQDSSRN